MELFQSIQRDHLTIKHLLNRVIDGRHNDLERRTRPELFDDFKTVFMIHTRAEEAVVYKVLRHSGENLDPRQREHAFIEDFIEELEESEVWANPWETQIILLKENLSQHFEAEENVLFELIRTQLQDDEDKQLARQYQRLKDELRNTAEPSICDAKGRVRPSLRP